MSTLTTEQQRIYDAVYDAVMEALSGGASAVENLTAVSAVGNEDTSLPVVNAQGQLVTILIGTLVALSAQNLSQTLALWAGAAQPSTDPGVSPYNKVYLAAVSGNYTNFLNEAGQVITLAEGEVALLRRAGTYWVKETLALLNKAYALAAADNANDAAQAVTEWFGADDAHGIRKTWKDWFSDSLSTGVRKMFNDWFGATASSGIRKTWSDWYASVQSAWFDWFGASDAAGIRGAFAVWFSGISSDVSAAISRANSATSSANEAASVANGAAAAAAGEAQSLATLKTECQNATGAASAAAQTANETLSSVQDAVRALSGEAAAVPVRMEVSMLETISIKNKVDQRMGVQLYPTYVMQNVLFQRVSGDSVLVNPSGDIAALGIGQTVYWVVPPGNTSLWQRVTVNVRGPRLRLTSTGKIRLNSGKIRIV